MAQGSLSFVSYAVNGSGVGHLSRQIAIQRWLRRLCAARGVRSQHWFLTTSEADTMLFHEGFAGFKLPSKSVVEEAGIDKLAYLALAKQWVWHSLALLRPDVLLVDTFPNGSFHELVTCLDLCAKKALVYRPVKEELAAREDYRALARLYDRVIIPVDDDEAAGRAAVVALDLPRSRAIVTGPVMRAERFELSSRAEARARIGVEDGHACLLVTGGGGGDVSVPRLFSRAARVRDLVEREGGRPVHLLFAAGPLYRGAPLRPPRSTWWSSPDLAEHLAGVDAAVCAAGFNTAHELLFSGVPVVFLPQEKIADDQAARVDALVARGAAVRARLEDEASIFEAVRCVLDDERAAALRAAAMKTVPRNHARDAAAAALSLVLPPAEVANALAELSDDVLRGCRSPQALEELAGLAASLGAELPLALRLCEQAGERGISRAALARVAVALGKKLRVRDDDDDVASLLAALVDATVLDGEWGSLPLLVQALPSERLLAPRAWGERLLSLAEAARAQGLDVFATSRLLHECAVDVGAGRASSAQAIFARAHERLAARVAGAAE